MSTRLQHYLVAEPTCQALCSRDWDNGNRYVTGDWVTKDILMAQQYSLIELRLPEPARLLRGEKHFHCHVLASPLGLPHLAVTTLAHALHKRYLLGNGSLYLEGEKGYSLSY